MRLFQKLYQKLNWRIWHYVLLICGLLFLAYLISALYQIYKPLPEGLAYEGKLRHAQVEFLADQTYLDAAGKPQLDQQIFNKMLSMIEQAQSLIVLDMFLFNNSVGDSTEPHQKLTAQLSQALIQKRRLQPNIEIKVITDPINSVYGGVLPEHYYRMRQAGIEVIETDLTPLRASNPTWSGLWYLCCQGMGNRSDAGWLPNPVGEGQVTLRSYLALANFKANHRKTMLVDSATGWQTLVSSMNPHDGSSRHSNVALWVQGNTAMDILKTEQTVGNWSGGALPAVIIAEHEAAKTEPQVQVLTEKAIYEAVLNSIQSSKKAGIEIDIAMFYLSERKIIKALIDAHERGVKVRVLLDPNKDAFGRTKNGMPNRQVAAELHQAGITVRWCNTQGEQCHGKMLIKRDVYRTQLILGSANFTARNLKNYNLETDLHVIGGREQKVFQDANGYFNQAWSNLAGRQISVDYSRYADESKLKYWLYRFLEWSGLSTF